MLRWGYNRPLYHSGDSFDLGPLICLKNTSYTLDYQCILGRDYKYARIQCKVKINVPILITQLHVSITYLPVVWA